MKIESRPVHGSPWQYRFYLDLQAPGGEAGAEAALEELRRLVVGLRVLGSYPSAKIAEGSKSSSGERK
jgi:chorismate mutase / prephenate dehydratase